MIGPIKCCLRFLLNSMVFFVLTEAGALLVTLGLLYPVASMIGYITREKQQGQKELVKMMSATELDIGWSWFMSFFLFNVVTATITAAVSMALFENSKGSYLWLFWLLTFLAIVVFAMLLSTFTSKSTRAIMIGLLIFFIGAFLTFAVDFEDGSSSLIGLISLVSAKLTVQICFELSDQPANMFLRNFADLASGGSLLLWSPGDWSVGRSRNRSAKQYGWFDRLSFRLHVQHLPPVLDH